MSGDTNQFGFWMDKKLTAEERNDLLVETCRRVFACDDGKIVLNMLMTDMCLLREAETEREEALNGYAKFFIRERLGVRDTKALTDFIAQTAAAGGG